MKQLNFLLIFSFGLTVGGKTADPPHS